MLRISAFLLLFLVPLNAAAFLLYTTPDGEYVKWHRGEIVVVLDENLEKLGPRDDVEDIIMRSFDRWTDEADIPIIFAFERGRCDPFSNTNLNCITACDDKERCYDREGEKGATTYLHFLPSNGRITGVSIVFNAIDWKWMTGDSPRVDLVETTGEAELQTRYCSSQCDDAHQENPLDLSRVATHEVGHLLGIDHSDDPRAIMFYAMDLGDQGVPDLYDDDVEAVTTLYGDYDRAQIEEAEAYSGCMTVAGRSPTGSLFSIVMLFLSVWIIRRAR